MRIVETILDKIKAQNKQSYGQGARVDQNKMAMWGFSNDNADGMVFDTLKFMWAENGDCISKLYAGTGSTITSVTKTGKQGFMGKID